MFTTINEFKSFLIKESNSSDRADKAKLEILIQKCKEMLENTKKMEEFEALKKEKNEEVKKLLTKIKSTSIIANGVLIQIIKPYQKKSIDSKEYFKFLEESTNILTDDFREISEQIKEVSKKTNPAKKYLRTNKNTRNEEEGTMKTNENKVVDFFKNIYSKFKSIFTKIDKDLERIVKKAEKFDIKISLNENVLNEELTPEQAEQKRLARNAYSNEYKLKQRTVVKALENAKLAIELAQNEEYYKQLVALQKAEITNLLEQFNAKSIAIGEKIIALTNTAESETFDIKKYQEQITNAELVEQNVAIMAEALLKMFEKTTEVPGYVAHYKDDTNSPEGTLDATFDYENKTVKLKESVLSDAFNKIMGKLRIFFARFNKASNNVDNALQNI